MTSPRPAPETSPTRPEPTGADLLPTGADIRLVVADMDGTLLAPDGTVPQDTWALLEELRRRGIVFVPASGRQYATLRTLFDRSCAGMVFIAENGSVVVRDGQVLDATPVDGEIVTEVVRRVRVLADDGADATSATSTASGRLSRVALLEAFCAACPGDAVLATGAGSLILSHVNDAGFWLVKQYFNMTVAETFKTWSMMETILSVVGIIFIMLLAQVV